MAQSCHPSGTVVPSKWHSRAIQVAQLCHQGGIVVPSRWHSRALGMAKEVVRMKKMADSLFFPVKSEYQNEFHP